MLETWIQRLQTWNFWSLYLRDSNCSPVRWWTVCWRLGACSIHCPVRSLPSKSPNEVLPAGSPRLPRVHSFPPLPDPGMGTGRVEESSREGPQHLRGYTLTPWVSPRQGNITLNTKHTMTDEEKSCRCVFFFPCFLNKRPLWSSQIVGLALSVALSGNEATGLRRKITV